MAARPPGATGLSGRPDRDRTGGSRGHPGHQGGRGPPRRVAGAAQRACGARTVIMATTTTTGTPTPSSLSTGRTAMSASCWRFWRARPSRPGYASERFGPSPCWARPRGGSTVCRQPRWRCTRWVRSMPWWTSSGAIEGFERLGLTRIYHRPVALGSGWVRAAHGVIPVPAPATAVLLEGLEVGPNGPVIGEATTPTGAVLLRVLSSGAPPARWRAVSAGAWGAGGRDPEGYPNALRLIVAEPAHEASEVVLLSTDLDDLSPEYLDPLREAALRGRRAGRSALGHPDEEGARRVPGRGDGVPRRGRCGRRTPSSGTAPPPASGARCSSE